MIHSEILPSGVPIKLFSNNFKDSFGKPSMDSHQNLSRNKFRKSSRDSLRKFLQKFSKGFLHEFEQVFLQECFQISSGILPEIQLKNSTGMISDVFLQEKIHGSRLEVLHVQDLEYLPCSMQFLNVFLSENHWLLQKYL